MHVDNAPTTAPTGAEPRPRARMTRLGRTCASLVVAVVAVATAGFMSPALAADVNGGVLTMNGTAKTVATTSAGSAGYVTFTATAGQRVQLQTSASTYTGGDPTVQLLSPTSTVLYSWTGNGFRDTVTLAAAGTYTFKATQVGGNGGITFKGWNVTADSTAALTLGTARTVTTTQGQNAAVTFTATANQRFQFQTSGGTYGAGNEPTVQLVRPDGTTVQNTWTGNAFQDTATLPTAGTWSIKVDPPAMATGAITITAWAVSNNSAGTLALNGNQSNVSTSQGQNHTLSFTLTANQRLQLQTSASSYASSPVITVYKPDGSTVVETWNGNAFFDTMAFATAGTYTMVIDPVGTNAGGITVQAWNVPADSTTPVTPDGTPYTFTTARGQNSNGTFALESGQRVMIKTSDNTYGGSDPAVKLIAPDGTTVLQSWSGEALRNPATVSASGSYTLLVDPAAAASGSITAQVWIVPADQNFVQPLDGSSTTVDTAPGQNATASFAVTAGQRLMFQTSGSSYSDAPPVTIYRPDGSTVVTSWTGENLTDVMTSATAGTYTLKVDPTEIVSGAMDLRIWNVPADLAVSPATNGASTLLTTTPGQNATVSFPMAANSRVMIQTFNNSYGDAVPFTLYRPDGTTVVTSWTGENLTDVTPLATAGTYTLKMNPQNTDEGSITVKVWNVPNDFAAAANLNGTAVNVATTPGQNATVSFAAAANQRVQIETTQNTYADEVPVILYGPDGTTELESWNGNFLLDTTRLGASAGTYYLQLDPEYTDEGGVKVQVWSVPEDADFGAMSLSGTAKTFTTVGGQNASATFQVTSVGQKIQTETSGNTYQQTPKFSLVRPDGRIEMSWYGNTIPTVRTFNQTGTWTVVLDPRYRSAGSIKMTMIDVAADVDGGNLNLNGTPTTLTTTGSGQNAKVSIVNAVAGSRVQLQSLGSTYSTNPSVSLLAPNGSPVATWTGNGFRDTTVLSEVGTYTFKVDPAGTTTGSITLKGWSVAADSDLGTIPLNGTPVDVVTTTGQSATMTFTGATGDRVMIQTSGSSYAEAPSVALTQGTTKVKNWTGNLQTDALTLPATGTYTITVNPKLRNEGSIVVKAWSVPADVDAGTITVDGAGKRVTTIAGGQNGFLQFDGGNKQKIKIVAANSTYNQPVTVRLLRPNGAVLFTGKGEFTSKVITLPAAATYKLFVNPQARDTGGIKLTVIKP